MSFDGLSEFHVASRHKCPQPAVPFRNAHALGVALGYLNDVWPLPVAFSSLAEAVRMRVPATAMGERSKPGGPGATDLGSDLIRCYSLRLVELSTLAPRFVVTISEKPIASALARLQSATSNTVTNLRHEAGQLGDFGRFVLPLLDGEHDRRAILSLLDRSVKDGRLKIPRSASPVAGGAMSTGRPRDAELPELLDRCLNKLARFALLVA